MFTFSDGKIGSDGSGYGLKQHQKDSAKHHSLLGLLGVIKLVRYLKLAFKVDIIRRLRG